MCSGDDAASTYFHLAETPPPAGASTQWLSFRFLARDFFRHSPGSHFAVVLRACLGRDATGRPVSISGRGMTLGDTSQAIAPADNAHALNPGFGGARGAQAESFWPGGNFLWREARLLDDGLRDDVAYRIELHVSEQRWIAFRILDDDGCPLDPRGGVEVQDAAGHPVDVAATGVLIALGRGGGETGPWQVEFSEIRCGWF